MCLTYNKMTCLFDFPRFQQVLEILGHSHIFAINMGEDAGMLDRRHFHLLAAKIRDGSSAVRRWFGESNRSRRAIWVECGLVRDNAHLDKPNVFTVARTESKPDLHGYLRLNQHLSWQRVTIQTCRILLAIGLVLVQRVKL
jgi:hypothetical protein